MLSYAAHTIIFSSYILFLIVAATLILLKLPLSRFVGLVGLVFGFVQEQHSEEELLLSPYLKTKLLSSMYVVISFIYVINSLAVYHLCLLLVQPY